MSSESVSMGSTYSVISGYTKKTAAKVRAKIAKQWFEALDDEEKDAWTEITQQAYDEEVIQFNNAIKSPPSTNPVDRQK